MRSYAAVFCVGVLTAAVGLAQTSPTVAGLAGAGAGAALGAGAGQNATTPSSAGGAGGAGGASAPIEIQVMAYHGLQKIATVIAGKAAGHGLKHLLIEDTSSATQVGLYQAVQGYWDHLYALHDGLQDTFALVVTPSTLAVPQVDGGKIMLTNNGNNPPSHRWNQHHAGGHPV